MLVVYISYFIMMKYFMTTSREVKKILSLKRSPFYALFSEVLSGIGVIRAFRQQELFEKILEKRADDYHRCLYNQDRCNKWIGLRTDLCGTAVIA